MATESTQYSWMAASMEAAHREGLLEAPCPWKPEENCRAHESRGSPVMANGEEDGHQPPLEIPSGKSCPQVSKEA